MATLGVSDLHQSQEKNSDLWAAVKLPATQHSSWSVLATRPATAGSSSADYFYIELFQMTNFVPVKASVLEEDFMYLFNRRRGQGHFRENK